MITFKQFISENVSRGGKSPAFKNVDEDEVIKILRTHCSDALWMFKDEDFIWRGDKQATDHLGRTNDGGMVNTGYLTVNPAATRRRSENTSNHYTLIFDNIDSMKGFPKRSRSFIGTTDESVADGYGRGYHMAMIPFNGVKIGIVGRPDMWETPINLFGFPRKTVETVNDEILRPMDLSDDDWGEWIDFDKALKDNNPIALKRFQKGVDKDGVDIYKDKFLLDINSAYSPEKTGFTWETTATLKKKFKFGTEVWVGGRVLMISKQLVREIRAKLKDYL